MMMTDFVMMVTVLTCKISWLNFFFFGVSCFMFCFLVLLLPSVFVAWDSSSFGVVLSISNRVGEEGGRSRMSSLSCLQGRNYYYHYGDEQRAGMACLIKQKLNLLTTYIYKHSLQQMYGKQHTIGTNCNIKKDQCYDQFDNFKLATVVHISQHRESSRFNP